MTKVKEILTGIKDGKTLHYLYNTYQLMIRRCYDSEMMSYKNYGALGVSVCERWTDPVHGFWSFVDDMGDRPEGTTLDRLDPYGNYEPTNCQWADKRYQANNTRTQGLSTNTTSGAKGVSWCKRDNYWVVQMTLNKKRVAIGRFSYEDFDSAQSLYLEAREMKLSGHTDDEIFAEFITSRRNIGKKTKQQRNKTSKYWGVSMNKRGKWIACTTEYLGISDTEDGAYAIVLEWLKDRENGSSS